MRPLEFQTAFTCSVCKSSYTTVVFKTRAVKRNLANARFFSTACDKRTDFLSSFDVASCAFTQFFFNCRGRCQNSAAVSRDNLRIDMTRCAVYAQTYSTLFTHL